MDINYNMLNSLPKYQVLSILHDCVEVLGAVSVAEYARMEEISKRAAIDRINLNKVKCFKFDERNYPCMNIF